MKKSLHLIKKSPPKGFFVLLFLLMVSLVGFAQRVAIHTTFESANPFAGHNLNFTNPIILTPNNCYVSTEFIDNKFN